MTEQWKPIPGWEDYEVSNQGRVRSLPRFRAGRPTGDGRPSVRPVAGKVLTTRIRGKTRVVNLWADGRPHQVSVAAIMEAAHG